MLPLLLHQAHYEKNSVLELRFRPEDVYSKPAVARSTQATNIVLRVRRRRRRSQGKPEEKQGEGEGGERGGGSGGEGDGERLGKGDGQPECSVEVVGLVKSSYDFPGILYPLYTPLSSSYCFFSISIAMADFQALPPGLSRVTHGAEPMDPSIFQLTGQYLYLPLPGPVCLASMILVCTEVFDESFQSSQVPLFLPPRIFSKFDKPCNYA